MLRVIRDAGLARAIRTLLWLLVAVGVFAGPAHAADWYVRPNGGTYGLENGTDWSNAFDGFADIAWSSIAPGDTIWVAGGTYTQTLAPAKSGTSTSRIYIRRARGDAAACTNAAGWSTALDSTVHQVRQGIRFDSYNYITVSGRTTSSGGAYGWWIDFQGATAGVGIEWPNGSTGSNIAVEYFRLQGPGPITYTADGRGIDDTPFTSATNHTFSHLEIFGWETGAINVGMSNPTYEYIDMYDIHAANWSSFHPNGIVTWSAPNGIVRYSKFHRGPAGYGVGEGIFFEQSGGATGWQIYGNVFYNLNQVGWKAIEITSAVGAIKVYNNTFHDILTGSLYTTGSPSCVGGEWRNNLNYQSANNTCGTASNNLVVSTASVFADAANHDYHIVGTTGSGYPRNAGVALTANSFYNVDMDGNTRGSDGTWDIGAFEFADSAAPTAPAPPTDVQVR